MQLPKKVGGEKGNARDSYGFLQEIRQEKEKVALQTEMLQKAKEYVEKISQRDDIQEIEAILLCGSLARGAATPFSDIDLWVICRKKPKILNEVLEDLFTIDVRYYTPKEIKDLINEEDTEAVGAFVQGTILLDNGFAERLKFKLKNFQFSEKAFSQWLENARSYLDDAIDLLGRGEHKAAKINSRYAAESAVIALLLGKNVMYPGLKWTHPLLRQFAEEYSTINSLYEEINEIDGNVDTREVEDTVSKANEVLTLVSEELEKFLKRNAKQ